MRNYGMDPYEQSAFQRPEHKAPQPPQATHVSRAVRNYVLAAVGVTAFLVLAALAIGWAAS